MYYVARWDDPVLGRFAQADTIVPGAGHPMAWDRYAYGNNSPVVYRDPSGHCNMYMLENGGCPNSDLPTVVTGTSATGPSALEKYRPLISATSTFLQDVATFIDGVGTALEIGGLITGGPAGLLGGIAAYNLSGANFAETAASWGSTGLTIAGDLIDGGWPPDSESSQISVGFSVAGTISPFATLDFVFDLYVSGYNHNAFPGPSGHFAYENYKINSKPEPEAPNTSANNTYLPIISKQSKNDVHLPIIAK